MRFDKKNPRFLVDLVTMIFALAVITLTIVIILGGFDNLLAIVFYCGAAMFAANIIRGLISRRYSAVFLLVPAAICVAGGLLAQGVIRAWNF